MIRFYTVAALLKKLDPSFTLSRVIDMDVGKQARLREEEERRLAEEARLAIGANTCKN